MTCVSGITVSILVFHRLTLRFPVHNKDVLLAKCPLYGILSPASAVVLSILCTQSSYSWHEFPAHSVVGKPSF